MASYQKIKVANAETLAGLPSTILNHSGSNIVIDLREIDDFHDILMQAKYVTDAITNNKVTQVWLSLFSEGEFFQLKNR